MSLPRPSARAWVLLLLMALGGSEYGLRSAGFAVAAAVELDRDLGWRKQPNQSVPGIWGEGVEINGYGFRDREWVEPAEAGLSVLMGGRRGLRVAVLGDSLGYGARLEVEEGFARVLEAGLSAQLEQDVLVQNFSMPGWTLEQMVKAYQLEASAWKPHAVVLLAGTACVRPALPMRAAVDYPLRRALERTAIWDFLRRRVWRDPNEARRAAQPELRGQRQMIQDPYAARAQPMWAAAQEQLAGLQRAVSADGSQLLVVLVPRLEELSGLAWRNSRSGHDLAAEHWQRMLLGAPAARFLDLRALFRRSLEPVIQEAVRRKVPLERVWGPKRTVFAGALVSEAKHPYLVEDSMHLSRRGHSMLAAEIFLELGRSGWLPEMASQRK